jgi:putative hydrolase of the HAD superfamily
VPLRAVAFDVDGTLYPNASMYLRSLGLALTNARLLKTLERVRGQLRDHPDTGADFHHVQARLVASALGVTPEHAYALIEARVYTRWYRIFRTLKPFPGLVETVAAFRAAGLKLAVLSDFPIRKRLDDLGLAGPWDCAFSSEETGYLKPHPQAFQVLASRLGMPCAHLTRSPVPDSRAVFSFSRYGQLRDFVLRSQTDPEYNGQTGRVPC